MKRIAVLAALTAALLLVFGLSGSGPLEQPQTAAATETTWIWPPTGSIQVEAGLAGEATAFVSPPCTSCWITRIVPDLIYQGDLAHTNGTSANYNANNATDGIWLHHFAILDSCNITNRFASGNERTVMQWPSGYGHFIGPGCTWILNYHIHNSGSNTRNVAIRLVVTHQTSGLTPTTPVWLDVATAQDSEYTIPTGYSDTHTGSGLPGVANDYTMSIQGKIIGMGGHVHDYGYGLSAFNMNARVNDYVCTSVAGYGSGSRYSPSGGPGGAGHLAAANAETLNHDYHQPSTPDNAYHIQSMSACSLTTRNSVVCAGDVIRLHSQYNNASGFPITDAMGIMVPFVVTPPYVPDADSDGVFDGCDTSDSDGDGFSDRVEFVAGTEANDSCADIGNPNDNAWPADLNNDRFSDGTDITILAGSFNKAVPPAPDRRNIAPDPLDGFVDGTDITTLATHFNDECGP